MRTKIFQSISIAVAGGLAAGSVLAATGKATGQDVLQTEVQTQGAAAASQQRVDQLADDSKKALESYRATLYKIQQLQLYLKELNAQAEAQTQEKVSLQQQLLAVAGTQEDIVPLMLRMVDTLEKFIALDKPFLAEERAERIDRLKEALRDPQTGIGERFRRVLEAYQVEAGYGRALESWKGDLKLGEGVRAVDFLKLGRVALYYLSLDDEEAGWWDPSQKKWVALDGRVHADLRRAIRTAREEAAPELLWLPVPAPASSPTKEGKS